MCAHTRVLFYNVSQSSAHMCTLHTKNTLLLSVCVGDECQGRWGHFQKCRKHVHVKLFQLFNFAAIIQQYSKASHYGFYVCMLTVGMKAGFCDDSVTVVCQQPDR